MIILIDKVMCVKAKYSPWSKYGFTAFVVVTTLFVGHSMLFAADSIIQSILWSVGPIILILVNIDAYMFEIVVEEGRVIRDGLIRKEVKLSTLQDFRDEEKRLILRSGPGLLQYIYVSKQLSGYKRVEDAILSQVREN